MALTLARPNVGSAAPDIELDDIHGRRWRLSDHRGKRVVVIFHRHIH